MRMSPYVPYWVSPAIGGGGISPDGNYYGDGSPQNNDFGGPGGWDVPVTTAAASPATAPAPMPQAPAAPAAAQAAPARGVDTSTVLIIAAAIGVVLIATR